MTDHSSGTRMLDAACLMLAVIQSIMLASLFFDVAPHPPRTIPLFAMAPFLGVAIGTALCARILIDEVAGRVLAGVAALFALLSFGPQKFFDPAFGEIWIAVVTSQLAVLVIAYALVRSHRQSRAV